MVFYVDNKTGVRVKPPKNPVFSDVILWFTDALGSTPTIPQADWFNMIQSELLGIADSLGVTPDKLDDGQLGLALTQAFEKVGADIGNLPKVLDSLGDDRANAASQRIVNVVNKLAKDAMTAANLANDKANEAKLEAEKKINRSDLKNNLGRSSSNPISQEGATLNLISGNSGGGGYVFACTLRRNRPGIEGWSPNNDENHQPINFGRAYETEKKTLVVTHKGGKAGSVLVNPDETLVKSGLMMGVSGGVSESHITMVAPCSIEINGLSGNIFWYNKALFSLYDFDIKIADDGLISITHPEVLSENFPKVTHFSETKQMSSFIVHYRENTLTPKSSSFYLKGALEGSIKYIGNDEFEVSISGGGGATAEINRVTKRITITHDSISTGSRQPNIALGSSFLGRNIQIFSGIFHSGSFSFYLSTIDNLFPDFQEGDEILFSRGESGIITKEGLQGRIKVDFGITRVDPKRIDSPTGNIWLTGINSDYNL